MTRWIKTATGALLNTAHAFELEYQKDTQTLVVWWAFPVPSDNDPRDQTLAATYNTERLCRYSVEPVEWERFLNG